MRRLYHRQEENLSQPECGAGGEISDYNLGLHVGALFIILFVSATGCSFALVVTKVPKLRINPNFLFVVRHFGTGVLLATAFVHLLPTAFISLTDPCLPAFWNDKYPAMAGAIALVGVFLLTIIEQIFSPGRHTCAANVPELTKSENEKTENNQDSQSTKSGEIARGPLYGRNLSGRAHSTGRRMSVLTTPNDQDADRIESQTDFPPTENAAQDRDDYDEIIADKEAIEQRKKALMQVVMLEMGILFHSVFIGMALAVATGNDQIVLLIAIIFHQTFEGLALGSRIADVGWSPGAMQPWIMALLYGCTTPFGQAIGIATRSLYSPDSATGLLVVGIFNALSSGFLTFNSLVDLLSEDFLSDLSWRTMRGTKRYMALLLVFFGAFCMSLVGAWA